MDPILYHAATGGHSNFQRQEVLANNLANVNTPGFKTDLYQEQTRYAQTAGSNNLGQAFTVQGDSGVDFTPGNLAATGRNLDVALAGDGWFAVSDSRGKESYTKAGSLRVNTNGLLVTASGKTVMGNGGPISIPPAQSIDVGTDGTVSIVPLGSDAKSTTVIDRIKMVTIDKGAIKKNSEGLFQLKNGGIAPADPDLKLVSGMLEGSNVQAIDQMVAMITAGRDFETHMNLMTTVSDNSEKLAQIIHE